MATVTQKIAAALIAKTNCAKSGNDEWHAIWTARLDGIERNTLPSGSGFDNGTTIDHDATRGDRLVLLTAFHHMDDNGSYCGWTEHTVIVTPTFAGFDIRVTGRNKRDIKDYIADVFHACLSEQYEWPAV